MINSSIPSHILVKCQYCSNTKSAITAIYVSIAQICGWIAMCMLGYYQYPIRALLRYPWARCRIPTMLGPCVELATQPGAYYLACMKLGLAPATSPWHRKGQNRQENVKGYSGWWNLSQLLDGEAQVTPWEGHWFIAGSQRQTTIPGQFRVPIHLLPKLFVEAGSCCCL